MGEVNYIPLKHVRRSRDGDEPTNIPCAICKEPGNRTLYKCEVCGSWVCEWNCLVPGTDICKSCIEKQKRGEIVMPARYLMTAKSDLKKYTKLNGYKAEAFSPSSFIRHLSAKFNISEVELRRAVKLNKVRIYI